MFLNGKQNSCKKISNSLELYIFQFFYNIPDLPCGIKVLYFYGIKGEMLWLLQNTVNVSPVYFAFIMFGGI